MVGKAEMGQHVSSAMAQIVAEELEADWRMMNIAAGRTTIPSTTIPFWRR